MSRILWTALFALAFAACRADEPAIPTAALPGSSENAALGKPELLDTLPENVRTAILSCRSNNQFYDLRSLTCGDAKFPTFACALDGQLRAAITPTAQQELDTYLKDIDPDLRLYDCTIENDLVYVHFYKYEEERIRYSILKLAPL